MVSVLHKAVAVATTSVEIKKKKNHAKCSQTLRTVEGLKLRNVTLSTKKLSVA